MLSCDCNRSPERYAAFNPLNLGLRQSIAAYLAACLVLAGAIGLSPALHTLVEHGGTGAPHIHGRLDFAHAQAMPHRHGGDEEHTHVPSEIPLASSSDRAVKIFAHSADAFPGADVLVARLWERLQEWLAQRDSSEPQSEQNGGHHHDSLASLLAAGLIELSESLVPCLAEPPAATLRFSPSSDRVPAFDWQAQSAPRGPPTLPG